MSVGNKVSRGLLRAQPDHRLVALCRRGHDEAFEEIVRRYRTGLVAFAGTIVPFAIAEEVVQSGLARAHDRLLSDPREIKLKPWLFTIVRNGALNAHAAERAHSELGEAHAGGASPAERFEASEEFERVVNGILALPEKQRAAIVRREIDGAGYGEIAAELMTTPGAVRGLIFRARTALRESLGLLIPTPLVTAGLASGSAATGGAGALAGAGAAPKLAATAAAIAVAVGGGVAVQGGDRSGGSEDGRSERPDGGGEGSGDRGDSLVQLAKAKHGEGAAPGAVDDDDDEDRGGPGDDDSGDRDKGGRDDGRDGEDSRDGGGNETGPGGKGEDREDDSDGPGAEPEGDDDTHDDGGNSGPGNGEGDDTGPGEGEEEGETADEEEGSGGSESSGSGSGDGESGGGDGESGADDERGERSGSGGDGETGE